MEKIRKRFAYLEPSGIGAENLIETFHFQLDSMDIQSEIYSLCLRILGNLEKHSQYKNEPCYAKAMRVIQRFKNPPALDYYQTEPEIIPANLIIRDAQSIQVQINSR